MVTEFMEMLKADPWVWNFLAVTAGMLIHTVKQCHAGDVGFFDYWKMHKKRSASALLSMYGSYFALMISNSDAGAGEFLAIGYMLDSLLNKAPDSKEIHALKTELETIKCQSESSSS